MNLWSGEEAAYKREKNTETQLLNELKVYEALTGLGTISPISGEFCERKFFSEVCEDTAGCH